MFSNLGNIFINKPRQAETTDTRLGIRRHEPDQERRRKKKKEDENPVSFDEGDSATVSTSALRVFLENFLKSQIAPEKQESQQQKVFTAPQTEAPVDNIPSKPRSGKATQAINAYETTAQKAQQSMTQSESSEAIAADLGLESHEIRTIHKLLNDLKTLEGRNIEYLQIERSDSFLNSLVAAVEKVNAPKN